MTDFSALEASLDSEGMLGFVRGFANDCAAAFNRMEPTHHPWLEELATRDFSDWLCVGMGGSAAGGAFLSDLADFEGDTPIRVHRDYGLPAWWSPNTLVVATSYSGNTEETISAVERTLDGGGTAVVICSGGVLAGICDMHQNAHLVLIPSGQPPRSAFGHLFGSQLSLAWALGVLSRPSDTELVSLVESLKAHVENSDIVANPDAEVASLALELLECPIAIVAPGEFTGVAERFRNQLNENAARFARVAILPEMNHNEVVAWGDMRDADPDTEAQGLLVITWNGMHERVAQRFDFFIEHLRTGTAWRINSEGESLLEAMLHACVDMDWLSCALALSHGKDPSAIGPISGLKDYLASNQ